MQIRRWFTAAAGLILAPVLCATPVTHPSESETPRTGLLAFRQALLDAATDTRVLIVATHPDDPYRGLALVLRRRYGMRVRVLVATRGEGGQNAVGSELGAELREIRTAETERAARILDVELQFLDLPDFGYCRTAAEALDRWRQQMPLTRLRQVLDDYRPDLVLTPHRPGEPHGQKRAVFHLLETAIGLTSPRPRFFRGVAKGEKGSLSLDLEALIRDLGKTYREVAFEALQQHVTQAPPSSLEEGIDPQIQLRQEGKTNSLYEGLPSMWSWETDISAWLEALGVEVDDQQVDSAWLRRNLSKLPETYKMPEGSHRCLELLTVLRGLRARASAAGDTDLADRLQQREDALGRAVLAGIGIHLRFEEAETEWIEGQPAPVQTLLVSNSGSWPVAIAVDRLAAESSQRFQQIGMSGTNGDPHVVRLRPGDKGQLAIQVDRRPGIRPRATETLVMVCSIEVRGEKIGFAVRRRFKDMKTLEIEASPGRFLADVNGKEQRFSLRFRKPRGVAISGLLAMSGPLGCRLMPESDLDKAPIRVDLPAESTDRQVSVRVSLPRDWRRPDQNAPRSVFLTFKLEPLQRGGTVPRAHCIVQIDPVRIQVPHGVRIGLLKGPDETVQRTLESLGLQVGLLDEDTVARESLDNYDTILVDSRALRRREDLRSQVGRLLAYVRRGGHLVVLYHKDNEFNVDAVGDRLAPYPLTLGTERITREDAPVRVLLPKHRLMTTPNVIVPADWDSWVQERCLYLPAVYSDKYEEILSMREVSMRESPGIAAPKRVLEFAPQRGALLYATYEKGSYVYCALVLHRQLHNYHHGAARLLVNLITPPRWKGGR